MAATKNELAKLRDEVLETIEDAGQKNPCLEAADRALEIAPGDPFFLWATLTQLQYFFRDRSHTKFVQPPKWMSLEAGVKELDRRLAESFAVLARGDDGSSDHRMLLRLANLVGGLRKVVNRPTPEVLAQARAHCEAYERTREDDFEEFEEERQPGTLFRQLRARIRAWETVEKKTRGAADFAFVPELVDDEEEVLRWALDPVVALDDFQSWASAEVKRRKHPSPPPRLGAFFSAQLKYEATAPPREMPKIAAGRALAVLLLGASDTTRAACDAISSGLPWGLDALLRAGMDPNTICDDDERETLLHFAVTSGEAECVERLLAAGADPSRKTKKGATALSLARSKKKPAVLRALEAGAGAPKPAAARLDPAKLIAAAKKLPAKRLERWGSFFGEKKAADEFAETLEALGATPLEDWSDLFGGALRDRLPWQRLALARAASSLAKKAGASDELGTEPHFVMGSLEIDGSLHLTAPLVVAGDLSVTGMIVDDERAGSLVVAGTLTATAIVTQNDLLVGGDCKVEQFVLASGNDHVMMVDGAFETPLLVDEDHAIEAGKERIGETVAPDATLVKKRFVKGALESGSLSADKIGKLVRANKPVFR